MPVASRRVHTQRPRLLVVFDTSVVYTGSESDLVQQEVARLVQESKFPDLEIQWYLPDIVRHERQYQMQRQAGNLLPTLAKVEKLLGHHLGITEAILVGHVEEAIGRRCEELALLPLGLDWACVDWSRVVLDAVYRRPPYQHGEKEKGFRDCIIVECFLQLVERSPKTPSVCRVVLVTNDGLIAQAARARTAECSNVSVLATLEELKGLINTLVSQVSEGFLAILKPKAEKLFLVVDERSTLFYKAGIRQLLQQKFKEQLLAAPSDATGRTNGTWRVNSPNFVKKIGKRIHWSTRISIECEAVKGFAPDLWASEYATVPAKSLWPETHVPLSRMASPSFEDFTLSKGPNYFANAPVLPTIYSAGGIVASSKTTHKGVDTYEILWSTDVTTRRELRNATVDGTQHVGLQWEQVS